MNDLSDSAGLERRVASLEADSESIKKILGKLCELSKDQFKIQEGNIAFMVGSMEQNDLQAKQMNTITKLLELLQARGE